MRRLGDFEGRWRVARRIDDWALGRSGTFEGTVLFSPREDGLLYHEAGELQMEGAPVMAATRDYLWRERDDGIDVYFDDGRFFHRVGPTAAHWCDPDQYDVSYDFTLWPDWASVWDVRGPRKNYRMESAYTRISP
ncbi:DUF6314 family protein [Maritimibacter dapengensis]|uniref:Trigger factor n=1 Tax=Maritimibacter dapengensis TaxID=2836868 RepID=A0ABS6SZG3_9RHOB|nr:DUF6314 family protein [Maritimibacter dapengensis]MBV7378367.1 trigger factor [Maritimibacter dapengensis]